MRLATDKEVLRLAREDKMYDLKIILDIILVFFNHKGVQ
jgi:hypothetical protein